MEHTMTNSTHRTPDQRVVITGMGMITPVGHSVSETWEALKQGCSGIARLTVFDPDPWACKIAGEVKNFNPEDFIPRKKLRSMPFASQLALIASRQAIEDAGLDMENENPERVGVLIGTAGGSTIEETERATLQLARLESKRSSPLQAIRLWPNMTSYFIAEEYQVIGYNSTVCTACASGTQAIGEAAEVIRRGTADVMISGGTESAVTETGLAGFIAMNALSTSFNDEPERAMRPFDADREGFVGAQGCAVVILESLAHAQKRDARIYAEVSGFGVSSDSYHMIAPQPEGTSAALAMRLALDSARLGIEEVDYINAHGTSTPLGDIAETNAIKLLFGEQARQIPISSTKSMVGHMMGAAGAVEAVACVMSIQEGIIHPTINYETPDPQCDLDYVPGVARTGKVRVAMSNSFGLGGQNAVLVLTGF